MAISVAHLSAPWFQSSLVLLALLAANATSLVRAGDTVAADRPLSGDRELVVSRGGRFALGFFRPDRGAVGRWYLGIWYHNIPVRTPVWVANRDRPVSNPAASRLTIVADGNLVLLDASGSPTWSTNVSTTRSGSNANATVVAELLDTGNLVLHPWSNASAVMWQSFDHIGDTWLPGAKLWQYKVTGDMQEMTSWRARGDPAPGLYTLQLDSTGALQFVLFRNVRYYWTQLPTALNCSNAGCSFRFVDNYRESYITYGFADNYTVYRVVMDVSGQMKAWLWMKVSQAWILVNAVPLSQCAVLQRCGAFGVCSEGASTACHCARGFRPREAARWSVGDYTGGCVRNAELQCSKNSSRLKAKEDRFFLMDVRLPDDRRVASVASTAGDCKLACLGNCRCSAFAYIDRCILWYDDLQNLGYLDYRYDVESLYLRLAASELPGGAMRSHTKRRTVEIAIVGTIVCVVVAASVLVVRCTRAARRRAAKIHGFVQGCGVASFTYRDLQSFTKNFSDKLGGGSFGSVFRGWLPDQRATTIAVKKLEGIRQGEKQFRAEVSTLATIHHVNLIRLLGFCSDRINKLLVYEYMPNGSLERHLFGTTTLDGTLSWRARCRIAVGVAKGLAYLHDKCRDRIIHCDVKPENILLDAGYVPKVADFGLAKLIGRDFSRVLTTMRGTVGYLAPEWIGGEAVTAKADVYSYGMMLFEIVSGKRNVIKHGETGYGPERSSGSDCHAAAEFFPVLAARRLQAEAKNGDVTALLDPALGGDADAKEVKRVCKVACWCIQDEVDARPTMAEVVQVLEGVTEIDVPPVPRYLEVLAGQWMHATQDYSS